MHGLHWSSSVRQYCLWIIQSTVLISVCFWPISGYGHQAGELYQKALEALHNKSLKQAESLLQEAIKEFPSYAKAYHLLGLVQYQRTQDTEHSHTRNQASCETESQLSSSPL